MQALWSVYRGAEMRQQHPHAQSEQLQQQLLAATGKLQQLQQSLAAEVLLRQQFQTSLTEALQTKQQLEASLADEVQTKSALAAQLSEQEAKLQNSEQRCATLLAQLEQSQGSSAPQRQLAQTRAQHGAAAEQPKVRRVLPLASARITHCLSARWATRPGVMDAGCPASCQEGVDASW